MGTKLSKHTAALYDRGGMRKIGELLDLSRVKWERVRDETSHATVWIESPSIECGKVLGLAEPGRHELVIFRGDDRVWEGPITRIAYRRNGVEIEARDITHYLARTIIRNQYDNSYPDTEPVLHRLNKILAQQLARKEALDPPVNILPNLILFQTADDARTAAKTEAYEMTVHEHLENYAARGGIDYVVVGRSLILFDYDTPLGQTAMVNDADFLNDPIITSYGMELATYSAITDGFGNYGATPDVVDPYYGEWEILDTAYDETVQAGLENPNITVEEMQQQAARVLAGRNPTPVVVRVPDNSTINPCGNLSISDLVPGVWVPLTAELPGRTLTQMQKLDSMNVEETERGEQIRVTLGPNNGESGEIIVAPDGTLIIGPDYVWDDELGEWVFTGGEIVEVYLGGLPLYGGVQVGADWWNQAFWTPTPLPPSNLANVQLTDARFDTTNTGLAYTFTDVNLGPESPDRTIIVCAIIRAGVLDDIKLNGNTGLEGINGSGDPTDLYFGSGSGDTSRGGKWTRFAAPTGTTGTVTVPLYSGTAVLCGIMVWSTPHSVNHDPFNTDHSDAGQLGWVGGVTIPSSAFALAAHYWETDEETAWPESVDSDTLLAIGDGRNAQMAGAHTEEAGYVEVDNTGTYTNALGSMIVYTF